METYITSCNLNKFNLISHFNQYTRVFWKDITKCNVNDIVYIYIGRPYSQLMYKCKVVEKDCDISGCDYVEDDKQRMRKFMKLELLSKISSKISLENLLENGLKTVQCSTRASEQLITYINEVE